MPALIVTWGSHMLTKSHLLTLDPDLRAFTLVGAFMGYFALLEVGINAAIGQVMGIEGARLTIVGRNMGFDEKIKTLRALVDFFIVGKEQAQKFDALATRARKCGELRNRIAHTPFRQSPKSDGVEFFLVSAAKKLEFPAMDLSIEDFLAHIDDINQIDNDLRSLENKTSLQRVAEALMTATGAKDSVTDTASIFGGLFGLGSAFLDEETKP
ncbi:hypothetical protein [Mesorhizobium sp. M0208]|uniref:hypothetical protein n=1 Tax=Mesorhizobium sp. M0208 TaxID=2956916 RepID=UPI00333C45C7